MNRKQKTCQFCSVVFEQENEYLEHIRQHSFVSNYCIECFFCPIKLANLRTYRKHQKSCRAQQNVPKNTLPRQTATSSQAPVKHAICPIGSCKFQSDVSELDKFGIFDLLAEHTRSHLSSKTAEQAPCFVCGAKFSVYSSFNWHIRKHRTRRECQIR